MRPTPRLRYVVLHHRGFGPPHFDLMFERSDRDTLLTFRIPCWPIAATAVVVPLGDHRRAYLDYQGPVSGNRGEVRRAAAGTYARLDARSDSEWCVELDNQTRLVLNLEHQTIAPAGSVA